MSVRKGGGAGFRVAPASCGPMGGIESDLADLKVFSDCKAEGKTPSGQPAGHRHRRNAESMPDVNLTVDGKKVTAPAGTLLIEACKSVGIEVPSFCYYPNLSLQGACRMCLVKVEKMPKLQTACTTVVRRRHGCNHRQRRGQAGAQGHGGTAAGQPSAGLSGVRCRRRVRTAGHDIFVRRRGIEVHGTQEPPERSSSGRPWFTSTVRAASCAIAACGCAARAWTCGLWACRIAASVR